jgi:hypothetical protein
LVVDEFKVMLVLVEHGLGLVVVLDEVNELGLELLLDEVLLPFDGFQLELYQRVCLGQLLALAPQMLQFLLVLYVHVLRTAGELTLHLHVLPHHLLALPFHPLALSLQGLVVLEVLPDLLLVVPDHHLL